MNTDHQMTDPSRSTRHCGLAPLGLLLLAAAGAGSAMAQTQRECAGIDDDRERLACYDRAAGRVTLPAKSPDAAEAVNAAEAGTAAATAGTGIKAAASPAPARSDLSKAWELDPADKQDVFTLLPYKANYILPLRYSSSVNRLPCSPNPSNCATTPLDLDALEAKFQISVKLKAWDNIFGDNGALWFGYTQQSNWQLYNAQQSRPFRETDYEPEVMLALRTDADILGWRWRLLNLGFVHLSNGRSEPDSRSWNRVYAQFGLERGNFTLLVQPWYRLKESADSDDNPDIQDYLGSGELRLIYADKGHVYSALGRYSFAGKAGGLKLEWAFPLVGPLKGYMQMTSGYGESLIDYNHRQTTLGLGVLLLPW